jgi:hypothetical protein
VEEGRILLFLKKKKQKDFYLLGGVPGGWLVARGQIDKSFLLLFCKKEVLSSC